MKTYFACIECGQEYLSAEELDDGKCRCDCETFKTVKYD